MSVRRSLTCVPHSFSLPVESVVAVDSYEPETERGPTNSAFSDRKTEIVRVTQTMLDAIANKDYDGYW